MATSAADATVRRASPDGADASGPASAADDRRWVIVARVVLLAAIALRVVLVSVNEDSNDDHIGVVKVIAEERRLPATGELWEAHQPVLYHLTVAALWVALPFESRPIVEVAPSEARMNLDVDGSMRHIRVEPALHKLGQLVSCAAGIATVVLLRRFVDRLRLPPRVAVGAFALAALNPAFVGINVQATNDSFAILLSALTTYLAWSWFRSPRMLVLVWLTLAASAAVLSKGHALVGVLAVVGAFGLAVVRPLGAVDRRRALVAAGGFVVAVLVTVGVLGPYRETWRREGTPVAVNLEPNPFPPLLDPGEGPDCSSARMCWRPGNETIVRTYATFRLASMLREPVIHQDFTGYPAHRTSLWSRLYGAAHFIRYEQWPPSWSVTDPAVRWLGRTLFVVALVPTAVLVAGIALGVRRGVRRALAPDGGRVPLAETVLSATAVGYLVFIVQFTLLYRDFSTMKAIILLPGIVGFTWAFAEAWRRLDRTLQRSAGGGRLPVVARSVDVSVFALAGLYVVDVGALVAHLR